MFRNLCKSNEMVYIVMIICAIVTMIDTTEGHPHVNPNDVRRSSRSFRSLDVNKNGPVPSCNNLTFCTDIPYYPSDYVNSLLSLNESLKYLATVDDVPSKIADRMGGYDDEEPLCTSKEEVVQPKTAMNIDDKWLYVVNSESYRQRVRVEICQSRGTACSMIDGFAEGYRATCRQTYIYRQMLALGPGGSIVLELFKIPATCKCFVKFVGDPWMRFGGNRGNNDKTKMKMKIRNKRLVRAGLKK